MIRIERSRWTQPYVVRLGHLRVDVVAEDADQARLLARQQLCLELPRLWDLIQAMEAERFEVQPLAPPADGPAGN